MNLKLLPRHELSRFTYSGFTIDYYDVGYGGPFDRDDGFMIRVTETGDTLVQVFVADVLACTALSPDLVKRAEERQVTRYPRNWLGGGQVQWMFSKELASKASLTPHQTRPALLFEFVFDSQTFKRKSFSMKRCLFHNLKAYSFQEANLALKKDETDMTEEERIILFLKNFVDAFSVEMVQSFEGGESGNIVGFLMTLVNTTMPEFFKAHNIPGVFRMKNRDEVMYSTEYGGGHMHITSPIRRYTDFVCIANLFVFLSKEEGQELNYPFDKNYLDYVVTLANGVAAEQSFEKRKRGKGGAHRKCENLTGKKVFAENCAEDLYKLIDDDFVELMRYVMCKENYDYLLSIEDQIVFRVFKNDILREILDIIFDQDASFDFSEKIRRKDGLVFCKIKYTSHGFIYGTDEMLAGVESERKALFYAKVNMIFKILKLSPKVLSFGPFKVGNQVKTKPLPVIIQDNYIDALDKWSKELGVKPPLYEVSRDGEKAKCDFELNGESWYSEGIGKKAKKESAKAMYFFLKKKYNL